MDRMNQAERLAQNQSSLVHVLTWEETQAGIWEPPPEDSLAVATFNGLLLNCVNSGLYMVRSLNSSTLLIHIKVLFKLFVRPDSDCTYFHC